MTRQSSGWASEDEQPLPERPFFRKILEDLWEGYFTLIVWTLLLWVVSIPVVVTGPVGIILAVFLLAPGLAGLMVASGKAASGGFARLGDAARGTARVYWRSVALALPLGLLLELMLLTTNIVNQYPERQEMILALAFQRGLSLVIAVLHIYLLPLLALYDTSLKQTVQVSMAMVGKFPLQTLALLVAAAALLALTTIHPLVWLIVPGIWCVVVMNATWRLTKDQRRATE